MGQVYTLADAVTTTGVKGYRQTFVDGEVDTDKKVVQVVSATTSGAGSTTVLIQGSLDNTNFLTIGTITLTTSTTPASDALVIDAPWPSIRANVQAISGTGATCSVYLSF